jgi:hypothetical protein
MVIPRDVLEALTENMIDVLDTPSTLNDREHRRALVAWYTHEDGPDFNRATVSPISEAAHYWCGIVYGAALGIGIGTDDLLAAWIEEGE